MDKVSETWTTAGVQAIFEIQTRESVESKDLIVPTALDAGLVHTPVCGLGWRFAVKIDRSSAQTVVVSDSGEVIQSYQVQLYFDPHLIGAAKYGELTLEVQVGHLIPTVEIVPIKFHLPTGDPRNAANLGLHTYPGNARPPRVTVTITFSPTLGLTLPTPLDHRIERALEETLEGEELVDIKFYAFSRRDRSQPQSPSESTFDEYSYELDSDLDSDQEIDAAPPPKTTKIEAEKADPAGRFARRGRVVVVKDTAYKTLKALLMYLYTGEIHFRSLRSNPEPAEASSRVQGPICSPKSMYRLADKLQLGLDELKMLSQARISASLAESNILEEVFSSFTSTYPVIQELEVGILTSNFSKKAAEGLRAMCVFKLRSDRQAPLPLPTPPAHHHLHIINMGVTIEVLKQGDGVRFPQRGDHVTIHYVGTLLNGDKFDSSRDRGNPFETEIGVGKVIKGWDEGVPQLSIGTKAKLTVTPDFAYGSRGFPPVIPPNSTLCFEVELLGIN
ncbi:unnamed protein product [Mycena citricolor]|uniref:peptidylprolyl isomerase n=1 Tax=Mycena citricolor TaxID=2018698 RepID=A0AAD2JVE6_9AGAR|nr:unnamed protein product [Mycena citricolor]